MPRSSAPALAAALIAAFPLGCASKGASSGSTPAPASASSTTSAAPIGYASMLADGTLVLDLTAKSGGARGHGRLTYAPSDPKYQETLRHIGGIRSGEQKPVPPWPDTIDDAAVEATARAYVAEKKGWKQDRVRVEIMGTHENGEVAADVTYQAEDPGKQVTTVHLRVDQKARRVVAELP